MTLKELMEHEWKKGPCRCPLNKCHWRRYGEALLWWSFRLKRTIQRF